MVMKFINVVMVFEIQVNFLEYIDYGLGNLVVYDIGKISVECVVEMLNLFENVVNQVLNLVVWWSSVEGDKVLECWVVFVQQ